MWPFKSKSTMGAMQDCQPTFINSDNDSISIRVLKASNGHIVQASLIDGRHGNMTQEHMVLVPEGGSLIDAIAASLVSVKLG